MYASSENSARAAFKELKLAMQNDAQRAVHCLEKDLDALVVRFGFDRAGKAVNFLRTADEIVSPRSNPVQRFVHLSELRHLRFGAMRHFLDRVRNFAG